MDERIEDIKTFLHMEAIVVRFIIEIIFLFKTFRIVPLICSYK